MEINLFHQTLFAMNTRMDIILWGETKEVSDEVYNSIKQTVNSLELVLSKFNPIAETYRLNQNAIHQPFIASSALFSTLHDCFNYFDKTKGYFDVAYQFKGKSNGALSDFIKLDVFNQSVSFKNNNIELDFGGLGKGIALKQVDEILSQYCISNACISFGESSILTRGSHPYGDYWPFSFQEASGIQRSLKLNNVFLSISGLHNGAKHIYCNGTKSINTFTVCIRADNPVEAEVLSTALVAAPEDVHNSIIKNFKSKEIIISKE